MNMIFIVKSLGAILSCLFLSLSCQPKKPPESEFMGLPKEYYRYKYATTPTRYLDGLVLGQCLGQELKRRNFTWGVDRKKYSPWNFDSYLTGSEYTYYTTPSEMYLKKWVLAQPDNSITPVSLFKQGLVLNGNNVFDTLVNIHTVLRNNARWQAPYVRKQKAPSTPADVAQVNLFFNKFVDIRGDLTERGGNFRGDHPGSWYRIWGMMLKFMMSSPIGEQNLTWQNPWFNFNRDYLRVLVAGFAENIKFILPGFADDPDKARKGDLNARAANAAYWLTMTALNHPSTKAARPCNPSDYLVRQQTTDLSQ
ncbi:MAG: hypothetical protein FJY29_04960 [Betaproteobacteria bacterium]|nr:hypothetical protein [Betaproteobacteria bacterium]